MGDGETPRAEGVQDVLARVEAERARLLDALAAVDQLWSDFVASRGRFQTLGESDEHLDQDPVRSSLTEAEVRLRRAQVEVVVAGYLKRGKSTLLNSLLGVEVSSMRVTPETARPVYVSYGERRAWVAYPDSSGESETLEEVDVAEASRFGGFRPEESGEPLDRKPLRVLQRLPIPLLKPGIILKDTPGLDDANPELAGELEAMTLAELDRATATILVLCSPPGLSGSERRVIEGLDARRIDKAFIVCNFYAEHWEDEETRNAVLDHLRRAVKGTAGERAKVFPVNAKRAWIARTEGDPTAFADSGVKELLEELESYLASGVFSDLLARSSAFIGQARSLAIDRLDGRLALLSDPERLKARRQEHAAVVAEAEGVLLEACDRAMAKISELTEEAVATVLQPFETMDEAISFAPSRSAVQHSAMRFDAQFEAALSRMATLMHERLREIENEAKASLELSLTEGTSVSVSPYIGQEAYAYGPVPLGALAPGGPDWASVGLAAGVGALAGGAIAGGLGIALIAAGPVGWIAGAALGALLGGSLIGLSQQPSDSLGPEQRAVLHEDLQRRRAATERGCREALRQAGDALVADLKGRLDDFGKDARFELRAVESVLNDSQVRGQLERETSDLKRRLKMVDVSFNHLA